LVFGEPQHGLVFEIDRSPVGNVVEHDRPRGVIRQRGEVLQQTALRRPCVVRAGDQVAVDRPVRRLVQRILHLQRAGARQPEADRQRASAVGDAVADQCDDPLQFGHAERHAFA
jgi:hypothetical protein